MVVSRIANSCVEQAVVIIIIIVSVKSEQWFKSRDNNIEFNWKQTHIWFYLVSNFRSQF